MSDLRCWQCGVEPTDLAEITSLGDAERSYVVTRWPRGDHEHALDRPTPGQLAAAGDRAMERITREWAR